MSKLEDGVYDVIVIDAEVVKDFLKLELVVTGGARKGEVVPVRATGLREGPIELLGLPARLIVEHGEPRVEVER